MEGEGLGNYGGEFLVKRLEGEFVWRIKFWKGSCW